MAQPLAMTSRFHLSLPVVTYMHPRQRTAAIQVAVATLDEAFTIIQAVGQDVPGLTRPVRKAISNFLETTYIPETDEQSSPPAPIARIVETAEPGPS